MPHNISFFIPAYNCSKTIEDAILSILETNFSIGDELVIVNDCSTDNTAEVLDKCVTRYPSIKVIHHTRNKGGAAARNTAIENSQNELLFCLDADNVLETNSIKPLKEYLKSTDAEAASFQNQHFFSNDLNKPDYTWSLPAGEIPLASHLQGKNVPGQHGNYLFTKSSWKRAGGYAEGCGALDTSTFGLRQAITGTKFVCLENSQYFHRLDQQNSYWMKDAEANLWSVSVKAAFALTPLLHLIDENFVTYMFGKGRYIWFYNLKHRPIELAGNKEEFYQNLNKKLNNFIYPQKRTSQRIFDKVKRFFS